jgi:hypothetical protein
MSRYLVHTNDPFDWLDDDVLEKILGHTALSVVEVRDSERRLPDNLRPPEMPIDRGHPWPATIKTFSFERSRESPSSLRIRAHGPLDKLTVTFSDYVDRTWEGFARYAAEGWTLDPRAVCAQMDFEQRWTGIHKIRLRLVAPTATDPLRRYWFQFFLKGEDGGDEIRSASWWFDIRPECKDALARRFTEELKLKHAVVDGVDEYSV